MTWKLYSTCGFVSNSLLLLSKLTRYNHFVFYCVCVCEPCSYTQMMMVCFLATPFDVKFCLLKIYEFFFVHFFCNNHHHRCNNDLGDIYITMFKLENVKRFDRGWNNKYSSSSGHIVFLLLHRKVFCSWMIRLTIRIWNIQASRFFSVIHSFYSLCWTHTHSHTYILRIVLIITYLTG